MAAPLEDENWSMHHWIIDQSCLKPIPILPHPLTPECEQQNGIHSKAFSKKITWRTASKNVNYFLQKMLFIFSYTGRISRKGSQLHLEYICWTEFSGYIQQHTELRLVSSNKDFYFAPDTINLFIFILCNLFINALYDRITPYINMARQT